MTQTAIVPAEDVQANRILEVLVSGNLSALQPAERVDYFNRVCGSLGLNPLTKPFEFLTLNGKLVLYATKACTDQLRQIHGVSVAVTEQRQVGDLYMVTVTATDKTGRSDADMGVVATKNLHGEALANAMLKAVTKAKRRATLSICGLGMLDETEVEDIPAAAKRAPVVMPQPKIAAPVDVETGELTDAPAEPKASYPWAAEFRAKAEEIFGGSLMWVNEFLGVRSKEDLAPAIEAFLAEDGNTIDRLMSRSAELRDTQPAGRML